MADGTISIDTTIDDTGFKEGTKQMESVLKRLAARVSSAMRNLGAKFGLIRSGAIAGAGGVGILSGSVLGLSRVIKIVAIALISLVGIFLLLRRTASGQTGFEVLRAKMLGLAAAAKSGLVPALQTLKARIIAIAKNPEFHRWMRVAVTGLFALKAASIRVGGSLRSINNNALIATRGVNKLRTAAAGLLSVFGLFFIAQQAFLFGKDSVSQASNMASALTGLQAITEATGASFGDAKKFIDDYTKDGLVPATDAIIAYKTLLAKGFDSSGIEKILNVSKDTAAFNRQAGFTMGEAIRRTTEGIKNENSVLTDSAGITKNLSIMYKEYAASIGTTVGMLTEAQKRQAVLNGFQQEGAIFAGNAAKAMNTYAGQTTALSASLLNLKVAVGNTIIPIITRILPFIRSAIDALTIFFNRLATIMSLLFGVDISANASATGQAMNETADATAGAADAQGDLAANTEKAGKAAKGALASFDKLNVLAKPTDTSGAGGVGDLADIGAGAGIPLGLDATEFDASLEDTKAKVEEFRKKLIDFLTPAAEAFDRLVAAATPLGITIWQGLIWVWENVLKPLGEWAAQALLPAALDLIADAFTLINDILVGLQPTAEWIWENFLKPLAAWAGETIIKAFEQLSEWLKQLHTWAQKNEKQWNALVTVLAVIVALFLILTAPISLTALAIAALVAGIIILIAYWDNLEEATKRTWIGIQAAADSVGQNFRRVFEGIKSSARNAINSVIYFLNRLIQGIAANLNTLASIGNVLGFAIPSIRAPQIPYLATGAVIPPNSKFAAVLGDQRSGKNIEAPESLLRKIVRDESQGNQTGGDITINFTGDLAALARVLQPVIEREQKRQGVSLEQGTI